MNALGARVRLVKGAYREPKSVAYQKKADVDAAFARHDEGAAHRRPLSGDRHARPGDDRSGAGAARRARHRRRSLRVPDAVRHPPRPAGDARRRTATACASTSRSAASGFPTSCAGSASARPTSGSCCGASSAKSDSGWARHPGTCLDITPRTRVLFVDERMLDRVREAICGLHGHDILLEFQRDRMFLKCVSCGHESPGWDLNETPPTVGRPRGQSATGRVRPQLIGTPRTGVVRRRSQT